MLNQNPKSNLKDWLDLEPGSLTPADLSRFLYNSSPGLRLLFGPQAAADFTEIDPLRAAALIQMAAGLADYVILDLPARLPGPLAVPFACATMYFGERTGAILVRRQDHAGFI